MPQQDTRSSFPTLRSFFPVIEGYYTDLAKRIDFKVKKFDELRPRVASMLPFANGGQDVDPATPRLTINLRESERRSFLDERQLSHIINPH